MALGDLCTDPAFLDAWEASFDALPIRLRRALGMLSRAWSARLRAHWTKDALTVLLTEAECTQGNATFLLELARGRLGARLSNYDVCVQFEGHERSKDPSRSYARLPLGEWLREHDVLEPLGPDAQCTGRRAWVVRQDLPRAAAFLLGRAMAVPFNLQFPRRIGARLLPRSRYVNLRVVDVQGAVIENGEQTLEEPPSVITVTDSTSYPDAPSICWADVGQLLNYRPERDPSNLVTRNGNRMHDAALLAMAGCFLSAALSALAHQVGTDGELALQGLFLDDEGARVLWRAAHKQPTKPRKLNLSQTVSPLSAGLLGALCERVPLGAALDTERLEWLDLSRNRLGEGELASVTRMFMRCRWRRMPALRTLDLSSCSITSEQLNKHLAPCLAAEQVLGGLQQLRLNNNYLGGSALSALQAHAGGMRELRYLWLGDNVFSPARAEDFALWLKRDANWESICQVYVVPNFPQPKEKVAWNEASVLVDLATHAHELERDWRKALPARLAA